MPEFQRKRNRLPHQSYIGRHWYFITICTEQRRPRLSEPQLVACLLDVLRGECTAHAMNVYAYCFMPDHLHLELVGLAEDSDLIQTLKGFKGETTSVGRAVGIRNVWQKGYYDHILREDENADAVAW